MLLIPKSARVLARDKDVFKNVIPQIGQYIQQARVFLLVGIWQ
jgi:hypothetical protein